MILRYQLHLAGYGNLISDLQALLSLGRRTSSCNLEYHKSLVLESSDGMLPDNAQGGPYTNPLLYKRPPQKLITKYQTHSSTMEAA